MHNNYSKENQPAYLADLIVRPKCFKYLRSTNSNRFVVPRIKTKTGSRAFSISGQALWNVLLWRGNFNIPKIDLAFPP